MKKIEIANICENVSKKLLELNPQIEDGKLIWVLNGSTLCNFLHNIDTIDGEKVSEEFKEKSYNFIRPPKGDIDILYTDGRRFERGFEYQEIKAYQNISEEQRDYNFIDHNALIDECDKNELCEYKTNNGLKFIAKKPQYLFYYKYKELLACYYKEILSNDLDSINNKNILNDVINLYEIASTYCNEDELNELMSNVYNHSETLQELCSKDSNLYHEVVEKSCILIKNNINSKIEAIK